MSSNNDDQLPTIEAYLRTNQIGIKVLAATTCVAVLAFFLNIWRIYFLLIPFFLLAAISTVREFFNQGPQVIINQQGVFDKRFGVGIIYWKDIKRVYGVSLDGIKHVCLELYDENIYLKKRSFAAKILYKLRQTATGVSRFNIVTSYLDLNYDEIFETILKGCEIYSRHH